MYPNIFFIDKNVNTIFTCTMKGKLDYEPNRTPEQLAHQRLLANLALTDTERFTKMMCLIKLNIMLKKAKITHK